MAKYVNLDKIIAKLEKAIEEHKADISEENAITAWIFKRFIAELEKVPTVDVSPVRHGHFRRLTFSGDTIICSECKMAYNIFETNGAENFNFCPHCGAIMDDNEVE